MISAYERLKTPFETVEFRALVDNIHSNADGNILLRGIHGGAVDYFLAGLAAKTDKTIIVSGTDRRRLRKLRTNIETILRIIAVEKTSVSLLPYLDVEAYSKSRPHIQTRIDRMLTWMSLADADTNNVIITESQNLLFPVPPTENINSHRMDIYRNRELIMEDVIYHLVNAGYTREAITEQTGTFSVRGGILDFFSPLYIAPIRLEFDGDIIHSIRLFDTSTQISMQEIDYAAIIPVSELYLSETLGNADEESRNFFRFASIFPEKKYLHSLADKSLFVHLDPINEKAVLQEMKEHFETRYGAATKSGLEYDKPSRLLVDDNEILETKDIQHIFLNNAGGADVKHDVEIPVNSVPFSSLDSTTDEIIKEVKKAVRNTEQLIIFAEEERKAIAFKNNEILTKYNPVYLDIKQDEKSHLHPAIVSLSAEEAAEIKNKLSVEISTKPLLLPLKYFGSFELSDIGFKVFGSDDLFAPEKKLRRAKKKKAYSFSLEDLEVGDYIIHHDHGLGIYRGLKTIERELVESEFIELEYAGRQSLYLPVDRLDLLDRYIVMEGAKPSLDTLGSKKWQTRKNRVKKSVEDMARSLINLYASRQLIRGYKYQQDTPEQRRFEESFPYTETEDQKTAIEDVKSDLETDKPADRLVVGDVGFGKTEVALRAAFKAAMEGKQTAVLTPTTVLAFQHYRNFSERLKNFPVKTGMLSRLVPPAEQKITLEKLEAGEIDIVIGTHRLLSKDIKFKDLGLIVIDEEQRFGVKHKEKLKILKHQTDVITLTATPIPRTLYLSMVGIRDLSLIETPPENRLAVKTEIVDFDEDILAEAIRRELKRGGQVYFVHNRIDTLDNTAARIKKMVPDVKLAIAHGQMNERELEKIILSFINNEIDLLLSTTIVENGLDISNVNTLIVNNAQNFGLAQLYQLRGRVGRSARQAYCYLVVPPFRSLTPTARKRLETLAEFSQLGAGFRIAGIDMEIRGAGNILGAEQTGKIADVGFDLYTRMLEKAVLELKGESTGEEKEHASIELAENITINEAYIPDTSQRLALYRRVASTGSEEEISKLRMETEDRYGKLPAGVKNLFSYGKLRVMANNLGISKIARDGRKLIFKFEKDTSISPENLYSFTSSHKESKFLPDGRLIVDISGRHSPVAEAMSILEFLKEGNHIS